MITVLLTGWACSTLFAVYVYSIVCKESGTEPIWDMKTSLMCFAVGVVPFI